MNQSDTLFLQAIEQENKNTAGKQLDLGYKTVKKLEDVHFHTFSKQINYAALASEWDANLFDFNTVALTADEIDQDDLDAEEEHDPDSLPVLEKRRSTKLKYQIQCEASFKTCIIMTEAGFSATLILPNPI